MRARYQAIEALLAGKPHRDTRDKALALLDWLAMTARRDHYPAQLSWGEMQRTAIARALMSRPRHGRRASIVRVTRMRLATGGVISTATSSDFDTPDCTK